MVFDPVGYVAAGNEDSGITLKENGGSNGLNGGGGGSGGEELVDILSTPPNDLSSFKTMSTVNRKEVLNQLNCLKTFVLEPLNRHPKSAAFRKPVDYVTLGIPDYPKIITCPMDLGTIKDNIKTSKYTSLDEAVNHLHLVWKNAKKFNPSEHFVHQMAAELEEFSKEKLASVDFATCKLKTGNNKTQRRSTQHIQTYAEINSPSVAKEPPKAAAAAAKPPKTNQIPTTPTPKLISSKRASTSVYSSNRVISSQSYGAFSTKDPLLACKEIMEELMAVEPYRKIQRLKRISNWCHKGIYVHPTQVACDFRQYISGVYRRYENNPSKVEFASQLHHKFEVMFARRVFWEPDAAPDVSDPSVLLLAQNSMLSIQSDLQSLFTSFYLAKNKSAKKKSYVKKKRPRSPSTSASNNKKRKLNNLPVAKVAPVPPVKPAWTRERIIALQTRIGQLDEIHQQPILNLMHKNGEKIAEDEEGYVVLDIEEASIKSLDDIKTFIDSLPPANKKPVNTVKPIEKKPVNPVQPQQQPPPQPPENKRRLSESSNSDSDDSSSSDSSSSSSDEE